MPKSWSAKREESQDHFATEGLHKHVKNEDKPERTVARTQKEEDLQQSGAVIVAPRSVQQMPAAQSGAFHVEYGERGRTYQQLYLEAREKGLKGRSRMSKAELEKKLSH